MSLFFYAYSHPKKIKHFIIEDITENCVSLSNSKRDGLRFHRKHFLVVTTLAFSYEFRFRICLNDFFFRENEATYSSFELKIPTKEGKQSLTQSFHQIELNFSNSNATTRKSFT